MNNAIEFIKFERVESLTTPTQPQDTDPPINEVGNKCQQLTTTEPTTRPDSSITRQELRPDTTTVSSNATNDNTGTIINTKSYLARSENTVGKPYESLREQLYNSLPIPAKVLPIVACEQEILQYENYFERPWSLVQDATIEEILEPFSNFQTTTSSRQRYGKILFLSRIITKYTLSSTNYDVAIITRDELSESKLYKAFQLFGFNYEMISTQFPDRNVFGLIVKIRGGIDNPADYQPIKSSSVDVIFIFDSACKMDLTKEFALFKGVHTEEPDLLYLVSMDCAEIRIHTYNRFIDDPNKMIHWHTRIGDLEKDILHILLLQPNRKPSYIFCHGWTDYLATYYYNWARSKLASEEMNEFDFKFPSKGAVLKEMLTFQTHHPIGKPPVNPPPTTASSKKKKANAPPPAASSSVASVAAAATTAPTVKPGNKNKKKAKTAAAGTSSVVPSLTATPPTVKKTLAPPTKAAKAKTTAGPSTSTAGEATLLPTSAVPSAASADIAKEVKKYYNNLNLASLDAAQSGLMDAMRYNAVHMSHSQQSLPPVNPMVGPPPSTPLAPFHPHHPMYADPNTPSTRPYAPAPPYPIVNTMVGSSASGGPFYIGQPTNSTTPSHVLYQQVGEAGGMTMQGGGGADGIHPARLAMMMGGDGVTHPPHHYTQQQQEEWNSHYAVTENLASSSTSIKRDSQTAEFDQFNVPSKILKTSAKGKKTQQAMPQSQEQAAPVEPTVTNTPVSSTSTTDNNNLSNIGQQLSEEYNDQMSKILAQFEKDVLSLDIKF